MFLFGRLIVLLIFGFGLLILFLSVVVRLKNFFLLLKSLLDVLGVLLSYFVEVLSFVSGFFMGFSLRVGRDFFGILEVFFMLRLSFRLSLGLVGGGVFVGVGLSIVGLRFGFGVGGVGVFFCVFVNFLSCVLMRFMFLVGVGFFWVIFFLMKRGGGLICVGVGLLFVRFVRSLLGLRFLLRLSFNSFLLELLFVSEKFCGVFIGFVMFGGGVIGFIGFGSFLGVVVGVGFGFVGNVGLGVRIVFVLKW